LRSFGAVQAPRASAEVILDSNGSVCAYLVLKDRSFVLYISIAGTVLQNQIEATGENL